jgi:type II secretory pathway component PulK
MKLKRGQTLVVLLIFVIIMMTMTSAAVIIMILNSQGASKFQQGFETQQIAESGVENALIRLLRDPNYTGTDYKPPGATTGEPVLSVGGGTVTTTVTGAGTSNLTITSTATNGNFVRKIQATATYNSNILTLTSWKELF